MFSDEKKKKINLLIIGKNSLLCKIYKENTSLKNFSIFSRKNIKKINFNKYTHVLNFAFNPKLKKKIYNKKLDFDSRLCKLIKPFSGKFIMISSRLVYSGTNIYNENDVNLKPLNTYGANKLIVENNVKKILPKRHLILRLSNILYDNINIKKDVFFYKLLKNLKVRNIIKFDFDSNTYKDFITPQYFSKCMDKLIILNSGGTFNVCSGYSLKIYDLAKNILQGYKSGKVIFSKKKKYESFYMSNSKLKKITNISLSPNNLKNYLIGMGKKLKHA